MNNIVKSMSLQTTEITSEKIIVLYNEDINNTLFEEIQNSHRPLAIDTEASGLNLHRDYLCLIQIAFDSKFILIKVNHNSTEDKDINNNDIINNRIHDIINNRINNRKKYPNLCAIFESKKIKKIFHYGRFDIAMIYSYFGVLCKNVFCTKIASRLVRTYTDRHGLQALIRDVLKKQIPKDRDQQCCDWADPELTNAQIDYAINDVKYLEDLHDKLTERLVRERLVNLAEETFKYLPYRAVLDFFSRDDIFSHEISRN